MTGNILAIEDLTFDGDTLRVTAVVEDAVLTRRATQLEPEEWGPGLCRGTVYFSDETLIPATDAELIQMLSDAIDDWVVLPRNSDFLEVYDD